MYNYTGTNEIVLSNDGHIYVTGWFNGTVDFNPTGGGDVRTSNGDADAYLMKMTTDGAVVWVRTFGGTLHENSRSIATDGTNIYITGYFKNTVSFNPAGGST